VAVNGEQWQVKIETKAQSNNTNQPQAVWVPSLWFNTAKISSVHSKVADVGIRAGSQVLNLMVMAGMSKAGC
jgi:hypothetical protein